MNRVDGLHPRTPGELEGRFPAAMAPRVVREGGGGPVVRDHPLFLARVARGWSAEGLAARAGVSSASVRCWERRERRPDPANRRAMARAFGLDPATIDSWFAGGRRREDR